MHLQFENKALKTRIKEFESGEAYLRLKEECTKQCRGKDREIRKLKKALEDAIRQIRQNKEHWFQVYEDMEKEHQKVTKRKQGEIQRLRSLYQKATASCDQLHEKYLEQLHLRYEAESALADSLAIKVIAEEDSNRHCHRSFSCHQKQSLKTVVLKKLQKRSESSL